VSSTTIRAKFARRMPDPIFKGAYRHYLTVNVLDLPKGISFAPNPRDPNIDRKRWKEIKRHLLNEEGTLNSFHLKNKGITLLAQDVVLVSEDSTSSVYNITFGEGGGIGDGGHTYTLITENQVDIKSLTESDPEFSQFVEVKILVGYDSEMSTEISGGLNTAIQVQEKSLSNHRGDFDWVKDVLANTSYVDLISWKEGEEKPLDVVTHVLCPMVMFHIGFYPNNGSVHPLKAYTSASKVLEHYLSNRDEYKRLRNILPDIFTLHDIIRYEARELYNKSEGGKAGRFSFIESKERGHHNFHFIGLNERYRLFTSALMPMLGAFRWMVEEDPDTGLYRWKGGFGAVLSLWRRVAPKLMRQTQATSLDNSRKIHAIGRSTNHWETLYASVVMEHITSLMTG